MDTNEVWMPVVGHEGLYEVSNAGRVKSLDRLTTDGRRIRARILKSGIGANGYPSVCLYRNGEHGSFPIHHLVAAAFLGPRPTIAHASVTVCHNDGDKRNNAASNLRYDSMSENAKDNTRHGKNKNALKTHCKHGHLLAMPNLNRAVLERTGYRQCLACNRARSITNQAGRPFEPDLADRKYALIMQGA